MSSSASDDETISSRASSRDSSVESAERTPSSRKSRGNGNEELRRVRAENAALKQEIRELNLKLDRLLELLAHKEAQQAASTAKAADTAVEMEISGSESTTAATTSSGVKRTAPDEDTSSGDESTKPPTKKPGKEEQAKAKAAKVATGAIKRTVASASAKEATKQCAVAAEAATSATAEKPAPTPKMPPVILRSQDNWNVVSRRLKEKRINFSQAKMTGDGIRITPSSAADYRSMTKFLSEAKYEYHTYALPEEKLLRVVIRGLPGGLTNEEIKEDLEDQGLKVESVQRMTCRRTRRSMPLVLAKLPLDQEVKIFATTRCCALVIKVERQRQAQQISQCFRCQRFGHAQGRCTAEAKCVKCGQAHRSDVCQKARELPAKCANCQGAHPASYRGCPSVPKLRKSAPAAAAPRKAPQAAAAAAQASAKTAPKKSAPPKSFAEAAKGTGRKAEAAKPPKTSPSLKAAQPSVELTAANFNAMLTQMQQLWSVMSTMFANTPFIAAK